MAPTAQRRRRQPRAPEIRQVNPVGFTLVRICGIAALAVVFALLNLEIEPARQMQAAGLIAALIPCTIAVEWVNAEWRETAHNVIYVTIGAVVSAMAPRAWVPAVIVFLLITGAAIPLAPRGRVAAQTTYGFAIFTFTALYRSVDDWYLVLLTGLVMVGCVELYFRVWQVSRDETQRRYDAMVSTSGMFFWEIGIESGVVESVVGDSQRSLGLSSGAFLGQPWQKRVVDPESVAAAIAAIPEIGEHPIVVELRRADGSIATFRHLVRRNLTNGVFEGVATEISELAAATATIRYQAEHDDLTGLFNRSVFTSVLEQRLAAGEEIALLLLDLDRFKEINDTLGHRYGDHVLTELASRFDAELDVGLVARLGGDEFAFLIPQATGSIAETVARQIEALVSERIEADGVGLSVSASVGIALAPADGSTAKILMQRADIAMYDAKRSGDSIRRFGATPEELTLERLQLAADLTSAQRTRQFEVWLQPKVDLATGAIVGAESLARWRHPAKGVLLPSQFLPLVMVSGDYHTFTQVILDQTIHAVARINAVGHDFPVAVNLSSMSFFDEELPGRLEAILAGHGVAPDRLILEITESDLLEDHQVAISIFERLVDLGVSISIDDFGTGHSSLKRLRELPVHEVKIDRSFVRGLGTEPEDRVIVRSIIELAGLLGLRTVAEGVETEVQALMLGELGCEMAQGFRYGQALEMSEFLATLTIDQKATWPTVATPAS